MAAGTLSTKFGRGLCNPVIKKMRKITDEMAGASPRVATFGGIMGKTSYFLILAILGVVAYFVAHPILMSQAGKEDIIHVVAAQGVFNFSTTPIEGLAFLITTFIALVLPLLAWLIRPLIPVFGTLYALAQGYAIGFMTGNLGTNYQWIGIAALASTMILVFVMLLLYTTGIAKVGKKFRSFISGFFLSTILIGLIGFVLTIIPFTRPYMTMVDEFMRQPVISIGISVISIIIVTLFLLVDFDIIDSCVYDRMPRKYEWMAAWGLSYTIIYLYLKIFNLIIKIVASSND